MGRTAGEVNRREFCGVAGSLVGFGLVGSARGRIQTAPQFDLLIRGGILVDGTGGPEWPGDIAIRGDRIAAIGTIPETSAGEVIDASGLRVAPGFIDIHTHSDGAILRNPLAESRVYQGITTEVTGNCGGSEAPGPIQDARLGAARGTEADWRSIARYRTELEQQGISVNHALLVGQGTLRENRIGLENRPLTPEELRSVVRDLEAALEEGAFGLSTGLEYIPGRFTPPEEIHALGRVVSRYGGFYASHIRSEERGLLEAIDEAIEVGRRTGVRVEISHLKAAGRVNWGKQQAALDLIESARRMGIAVLADAYPYEAYFTGLTIFLPTWALEGGWASLRSRLGDAEMRGRIRAEVDERVRQDPGDYDLIQISRVKSASSRGFLGKRLSAIAEEMKNEPAEALLDLLIAEEGSVSFVGFGMSEANVDRVVRHPLVMIGSDGSSLTREVSADEGTPHPRSFGAFARVLSHFVRERDVLSLPEAVRKMTSMPADQVGLKDRGRIAVGMKADLALFSLDSVKDLATYASPREFPEGIRHVLVNGRSVLRSGRHTGQHPGRVLQRA